MTEVEKCYRTLVKVTNSLLDAVKAEDPERLGALQVQYGEATRAVMAADQAAGTGRDFPDRARVLAFLLEKNTQIKACISLEKEQLTRKSTRQQQQSQAQKAYLSQSI